MAARVLLIRHASVDAIGESIAGRRRGVHLNQEGRKEAQVLVDRLHRTDLQAIYSSPMERAQETAEPLSRAKKMRIITRNEFTEVDFGEWTGKTFAELDLLPEWHRFNQCRTVGRIPGGESMLEVVHRMVGGIQAVCEQHSDGTVAIFSHCDPIRTALVHFTGMNLDGMLRLTIAPTSISAIEVNSCGARILALNDLCGHFRLCYG